MKSPFIAGIFVCAFALVACKTKQSGNSVTLPLTLDSISLRTYTDSARHILSMQYQSMNSADSIHHYR
jgi:hypothetical protein